MLEIFAGTGGVSACFKRHGFTNTVAVDKTRHVGSLVSVVPMDLTRLEDQQAVLAWIRHPAVRAVFLAPPCGTSSAARNIEIPGELAPRPLRSIEQPDGLDTLQGVDLARVSAANVLYAFAAEILCDATSMESFLCWKTPETAFSG